jgi:endonuclease/exonuclease/phosphatase family metal-dependent hydrolase
MRQTRTNGLRYDDGSVKLSWMVTANPPLQESEKIEVGYVPPGGQSRVGTADNPATIVVASYNIRYAVGRYLISGGLLRKLHLSRGVGRDEQVRRNIATAAQAFSAGRLLPVIDVLALQEADKRTARAGGHHVARELAEALGMNWIHVPAGIPRGIKPQARQWWLDFEEPIGLHDSGDTGIGMVSRLPLSKVARIDLPWQECAWRPRLAMAATVSVGRHQLRIINAHVDPHAAVGGQLEQLEVLLAHAANEGGPTLILGDFNTLSSRKIEETRTLLEAHGYTTPFKTGTPTWRGAGLRLHADWVFSRGVTIAKWGVVRPLNVSDHWPIWAEVDLSRQ